MSEHQLTPARAITLREGKEWSRSKKLRGLSQPVIDLLEGMGWEWIMTCHDAWEWLKFNPTGTCEAWQGGQCWATDVEAAKLLAAEDVWVPTMELRRQLKRHNHVLQQKWERAGTGDSEWRTVPTVDEEGEPYA